MDTNESDAMANQVDVDKIIFRNVFIDFIWNFYKDAYARMPKDFDLRWKPDFRFIFLPEISPLMSHDQLVKQLIKNQTLKF